MIYRVRLIGETAQRFARRWVWVDKFSIFLGLCVGASLFAKFILGEIIPWAAFFSIAGIAMIFRIGELITDREFRKLHLLELRRGYSTVLIRESFSTAAKSNFLIVDYMSGLVLGRADQIDSPERLERSRRSANLAMARGELILSDVPVLETPRYSKRVLRDLNSLNHLDRKFGEDDLLEGAANFDFEILAGIRPFQDHSK